MTTGRFENPEANFSFPMPDEMVHGYEGAITQAYRAGQNAALLGLSETAGIKLDDREVTSLEIVRAAAEGPFYKVKSNVLEKEISEPSLFQDIDQWARLAGDIAVMKFFASTQDIELGAEFRLRHSLSPIGGMFLKLLDRDFKVRGDATSAENIKSMIMLTPDYFGGNRIFDTQLIGMGYSKMREKLESQEDRRRVTTDLMLSVNGIPGQSSTGKSSAGPYIVTDYSSDYGPLRVWQWGGMRAGLDDFSIYALPR